MAYLISQGADVNAKDDITHETPLHVAVNVEITKLLLENGADPNAQEGKESRTPLHYNSYNEGIEIMSLLIEYGADLEIKDDRGETALFKSFSYSQYEATKFLFKAGANPFAKNRFGQSPYSIAKERNNQELVQLFETYNPPQDPSATTP